VAYPSGGPDSGTCNDPRYPYTFPRIFLEVSLSLSLGLGGRRGGGKSLAFLFTFALALALVLLPCLHMLISMRFG